MQCAKCIQHHLCVVVCINEHAGTRLEITDVEQAGSQDHHIPGTKTARSNMAVIQLFFYQCQHRKLLCLQLLNRGDHKLRINIGQPFNLLGQILGLRTFHPPVQILLYLVLTQFMRPRPFLCIRGSLIREVLLQPCGWRTVQPTLGTGCG